MGLTGRDKALTDALKGKKGWTSASDLYGQLDPDKNHSMRVRYRKSLRSLEKYGMVESRPSETGKGYDYRLKKAPKPAKPQADKNTVKRRAPKSTPHSSSGARKRIVSSGGHGGQDLNKQRETLTQIKERLNVEAKQRFIEPTEIKRVYAKGSKFGPGSVKGMFAVKLADNRTGWVNEETKKFWGTDETKEILYRLDRMAELNGFSPGTRGSRFDEDLMSLYLSLTPDQRAYVSKMLSEVDWEQKFNEWYPKEESNKGYNVKTKRQNFYEDVQRYMRQARAL